MNGPDLFSIKPVARRNDPETSHAAARDATPGASPGRLLVLRCLSGMAMTDYELADATGLQQNSIGKRRSECLGAGWVEAQTVGEDDAKTMVTRPAPSGSKAQVWQITPSGWDTLTAHANSVPPARGATAIERRG